MGLEDDDFIAQMHRKHAILRGKEEELAEAVKFFKPAYTDKYY